MNILYIMRYWPVYGGGETITVTLANEFIRRGHNVFVLYTYENTCDPMPYEIDPKIKSKKLYTIERYKTTDLNKLRKFIISNDIDMIINQWGDTKLCSNAKKGTNCKLITCWHLDVTRKANNNLSGKEKIIHQLIGDSLYYQYDFRQQLKKHKQNYILSDKYIFLSPSFIKEYTMLSKLNDSLKKLEAISNPLTYNCTYDIANYPTKKNKVLFVGRIFEYHKRLSYILKIWQNIEKKELFNDWSLTIVGDGPDMLSTKKLSATLNLRRVTFTGFKNPRSYYEESSIFMMTSAFEGFGMTLVEAQQYATVPIVMDTYGSLHDIIVNEENGIITPDNDLDYYTNKLEVLMSDKNYRYNLAKKGLESCKKFTVNQICNKWEKLFKETRS